MFSKRDLYGNLGLMTTSERTIPESGERIHYKQFAGERASDIETAAKARTIPAVLLVFVLLLFLLSR